MCEHPGRLGIFFHVSKRVRCGGDCWDPRAKALAGFSGVLTAPEGCRGKCICAHAVPSPSQICLRRTPQHRLAGPSHTKPTLQPPAQLCSPLSIGGGAETRRGAVCPGVGKQSCKAAFLLSRTSGLAGSTAPPPSLALLLLSLATHRARIRMETIKEARAYQYQGPPHWGLAWWFLSLHTKDKKMKPP